MILEYDKRPDATPEERIHSLAENIQLALNKIDAGSLYGDVNMTVRIDTGSLHGAIDGDYLYVKNLDADSIKAVDAWVDKLLVQTHLLANEGEVFELDAIQVNASKIKTGTLDVERLVITQTDAHGVQHKFLVHWNTDGTYTTEKLDGDVIEDLTITADKIVSGSIMTRHITTQDIEGTSGWINLRNGTFFYGDGLNFSLSSNCIMWNGSKLQIKADDFILSSGQSIVDALEGAIETWFYAVDPLPTEEDQEHINMPASDWTTDKLKEAHLRDIYFNTSNGHSFRWALLAENPKVYGWVQIEDADLEALSTRITQAETSITQNATSIQSLASAQATYIRPDGTTGENALSSAITQNAQNINLKVSKNNVIGEINLSSESAKIAAGRVDIEGATLFTSGRLSESSLDASYDEYGAASDAQTAAEAAAKLYTDNATSGLATKAEAVSEEQRIYYRSDSLDAPEPPSTWVASTATEDSTWTTKRMPYDTTYKYLYTCIQKKSVSGTVTNSAVLLDDTTTVIDGGNIITGSIAANKIKTFEITVGDLADGSNYSTTEQMNEAISAGESESLVVSHTYDTDSITYSAKLYRANEDITDVTPAQDFEWYEQQRDEMVFLGTGKSIDVSKRPYSQTVVCIWTKRDNFRIKTHTGYWLNTHTGERLIARLEIN